MFLHSTYLIYECLAHESPSETITNSWFSQPRKYYFPGHYYYFFKVQSIQDLKVINQDMCKKVYRIYSKCDQLLTLLWYTLPSCLLAVLFTHFYLNFNQLGIPRLCISQTWSPFHFVYSNSIFYHE